MLTSHSGSDHVRRSHHSMTSLMRLYSNHKLRCTPMKTRVLHCSLYKYIYFYKGYTAGMNILYISRNLWGKAVSSYLWLLGGGSGVASRGNTSSLDSNLCRRCRGFDSRRGCSAHVPFAFTLFWFFSCEVSKGNFSLQNTSFLCTAKLLKYPPTNPT